MTTSNQQIARYAKIRRMDISNGPGIRVSIFFQGCNFHCKGCFNPETWDFNAGEEFTCDTIKTILDLCDKPHIKGLSILGGEPLHGNNVNAVLELCTEFKKRFNDKDIWLWTGFSINELKKCKGVKSQILDNIDYIVDGRFSIEKKDPKLLFRGSRNQTIYEKDKNVWKVSKYNK